jgi:hypothetical protein
MRLSLALLGVAAEATEREPEHARNQLRLIWGTAEELERDERLWPLDGERIVRESERYRLAVERQRRRRRGTGASE